MFRLVHDLAPNHDAGENLDPFLVAFHNPRMNTNAVAHSKVPRIRFLLFFLDDVDDPIHETPPAPPAGRANIFSRTTSNCKLKSLTAQALGETGSPVGLVIAPRLVALNV